MLRAIGGHHLQSTHREGAAGAENPADRFEISGGRGQEIDLVLHREDLAVFRHHREGCVTPGAVGNRGSGARVDVPVLLTHLGARRELDADQPVPYVAQASA